MTDNPFRRFWQLGYTRLLPVIPPTVDIRSAGKRPGVKGPNGWFGRGGATFDAQESDLDAWAEMGAGVGLRCDAGIIGIDIDTLSIKWSERIQDIVHSVLGPGVVRIGNAPKTLLMFRHGGGLKYRQLKFDDGVDEKKPGGVEFQVGEHSWFVVDGVHPATKKPYNWPDGLPAFKDVPVVSAEQVDDLFEQLLIDLPVRAGSGASADRSEIDQNALKGDLELVAAAVRATPNDPSSIGYEEWMRMGAAIRAACLDDYNFGLDLFVEWTEKAGLAEETESPERVYGSFENRFGIGADYVFSQAERAGWTGRREAQAAEWFEIPPEESAPLFPPEKGENRPKVFKLTSLRGAAETALSSMARPLVKGLLDQGAMTVLYGESNTGKTFVAMDLAFHIAIGAAWGGMRTAHMPVLYVAAEGGQGVRKRAAALMSRHGEAAGAALFEMLMHPVNLLRADADLKPLIETAAAYREATGRGFGLIVIDTLSRAMAGGDENASTDMGAMVKHLDALRAATGAHLMVVHHSGKDKARGARGHSLLRAATDTEIEVGGGSIAVTKQRDLDGSFASGFALEGVTLGVDADGDPVSSCTVRLLAQGEAQTGSATTKEEDMLEVIDTLQATSTKRDEGVSVAEIMAFYGDKGDIQSGNSVRHLLRSLVAKGFAEKTKRGKWALKVAKTPSATLAERHFVESEVAESGGQSGGNIFE